MGIMNSGKFDHATIIRHQSIDFGFHVGRLRVNAGGDPFGFQVGEFLARDLIAMFQFSFRPGAMPQADIAPARWA